MKKKIRNRLIGVVLCVALILGTVNPIALFASEESQTAQGVVYDSEINIKSYRGEQISAPVRKGYVFAGWYKVDETAEGGYSPMSAKEADSAESAVAKFVDEQVLGFRFQLTAGTTIYSEQTAWRLLTSVDSLAYESVGFQVQVGKKTQTLTSDKVYSSIYGYEYKDAYNYTMSYTPYDTFSAESKYFMAYMLTEVPNSVFVTDIKVTPLWTTLDGTTVSGIQKTFSIDEALCEFGDNLQASKGTDFEGFATSEIIKGWSNGYYNGSEGTVLIINDGSNSYAKMQPVADGGYATITRAANVAVLKTGTYKLSMDVKLGREADGTLSFGIWSGSQPWVPGYRTPIDTSNANADGWTTVTYEYTLSADKAGTYANLDIGYTGVAAGENNYVMIDNIQVIDTSKNTNVDTNAYGDFENLVTIPSLTTGSTWVQDNTGSSVIYVGGTALENKIAVDDNGNKSFKFYTSTGVSSSVNFAGSTAFAEAGLYKMSVKVKLGSGATNVNNIGFRLYPETLNAGDIQFSGLDGLSSEEWVTLDAYFTVPETVATTYINMNFWVFTHNDEIGSADNYVLMDDIEVYPVTLKACAHDYNYEYITEPTTTAEGEVKATCQFTACGDEATLKVMMTPRLTRDGLNLTWDAIANAKGYKVYDNGTALADAGDTLSYTLSPETGAHTYTIEAYTDEYGYYNFSNQSNAVDVTVLLGDNLQASKGTDFEGLATYEVSYKSSANQYGNWSDGEITVVNDGSNSYAKMRPVTDGGYATITRAANVAILKAGTYKLSMDVKLGSEADGTLSFGIWSGSQPWVPGYRTPIDTSNANADGWVTVTYEYTLSADKAGTYANLDIGYTGVTAGENNYVMIDNIQVIDTSTNTNVDTNAYGDFENLVTIPSLTTGSTWVQDNTGSNVIYVGGTALENEIVVDDNGNKSFKFYTSAGVSSSADFTGSTAFAEAGLYKMSVKVKLGSGATNVNNIGFRLYPETLNAGDIQFSGLDGLSSEEWVTLDAYFTVPETVATTYINMNFWVFTHNDEIGSADNYVLMDDIEVYPVTLNGEEHPVYSSMIANVYDGGVITGVLAPQDTLASYNVGGTDLGIPYYDDTREQMYLLFGDTFSSINSHTSGWRSQVVGISTDSDLSNGLTFDSFISDQNGNAIQIIDSRHDSNSAGGEKTCIPTGGIAINGTHYVFYMSVREWLTKGWDINFCAVAKSTDGQTFEIMNDLYWAETGETGQNNAVSILGQSADTVQTHATSNFLQIYPYRVDNYVYLFGIPNGRDGGVKLGRVLVENIESFDKYEYYCGTDEAGNPIWTTGTNGLAALENNENSYIVEAPVGELSVCYNAYLGKYVMSYFSSNKIAMRTSSDLLSWSETETITTLAEYIQLYGGFAHELYMEENGKVMYFLVSQYANDSLGEEGYNVRLLKVIFK